MAANETLLNSGSQLCVECGLCCSGALHDTAKLLPEEIPLALSLGMKVAEAGDKIGFHLPCHLLKDRCCTVYAVRPSTCRNYQCQLLQSFEAGEIDLEKSLEEVRTAQSLLQKVEEHLPQGMTLPAARAVDFPPPELEGTNESRAEKLRKAKIKLHLFALGVYLDKHFRNSREGNMMSYGDLE